MLKPIDEDLLKNAIEKFRKQRNDKTVQQQLSNLLQQYNIPTQNQATPATATHSKIAVGFQDKILFYDHHEIISCHSNDNYTTLNLKNGEKVIASKTIRYFEDILTPMGFIRPHQSYIINSKYIQQYSKKDGGFLIMIDGSSIPVSRNRKEEILLMFKGDF